MTEQIQKLNQSLNAIAEITLNIQNNDMEGLKKAAALIAEQVPEEKDKLPAMFSFVHSLTGNYLNKLVTSEADDLEPFNEGLVLLRAMLRSRLSDKDFGFDSKDIADVVANLETTKKGTPGIREENPERLESTIELIQTLITSSLDIGGDDVPELGYLLNGIEKIECRLSGDFFKDYRLISSGLRRYLTRLILNEETDTGIITDCLYLLRAMLKSVLKNEFFSFGVDEMLEKLCCLPDNAGVLPEKAPVNLSTPDMEKKTAACDTKKPLADLDEEDIEILGDFIIEAKDNLESIELNLIDLEQDPGDLEIINAIFRPFHTIKGVSGFLDLRKINALSHSTENLLDSSRQGKFVIDHEITDIILESVDRLKQLLERVETGLNDAKTADDSDIEIDTLVQKIENTLTTSLKNKKEAKYVGEILVEKGSLNQADLSRALQEQQTAPERKLGEILVEEQKVKPEEVISALRVQKRTRKQTAPQVKVDTFKLDNLVDLTGELVIAQSMLRQNNGNASSESQKLLQNLNQLGQIVSNIQKIAMSMRMVPINATFQKMVRLVRDLSRSCKKNVYLEMVGEETEIDRNVVEALYEPMVHMIRNSIDHGLETEEERLAAGKSARGKITLSAYHKGGNIIIEISDDGKGLNKINILEKAIESGVVKSDSDLGDSEIFQLIMKPGFSTALEITDISGRGVGMDVVKKAITDLRGRIDIQSGEGKGTSFTISLPLTLAIIEGMLVRVGQEKFIIPTMAILESFRPGQDDYFTVEKKGEMLMFRNNLIPVVRLNRICNVEMDNEDVWENIAVVVENKEEQRGILIDELLGKEEFVIKSLGESLTGIKGLAGGAILGDGRIGLIVDISGIFKVADSL